MLGVLVCSAASAYAADKPVADASMQTSMQAWRAISQVERQYDIPRGLLHSMSLVETGQGQQGLLLPWPYTINVNHSVLKSFSTSDKAVAYLKELQRLGFKKFDIKMAGRRLRGLSATSAVALLDTTTSWPVQLRGGLFARRFDNKTDAVFFTRRLIDAGQTNVDIGLMQVNWKYHGEHFDNVATAFDSYQNLRYAVSYLLEHQKDLDWWGRVGRYHSGTGVHAKKYVEDVWAMYQKVHRLNQTGSKG